MRKRYTKEFKQEVVKEFEKCGNAKEVIERYGVPRSSLYEWINLYKVRVGGVRQTHFAYCETKSLKRQLEKLKHEQEIIHKAQCFKDSPRRQKLEAVESLLGQYPVKEICRALNLSSATFYNYHLRRVKVTQYMKRDEELKIEIRRVFDASDGRFGSVKTSQKLQMEGIKISQKKTAALMKEMGLKSKYNVKRTWFHQKKKSVYPNTNALNREFMQDKPNKFWVSDTSFIRVGRNFFVLCVIIDLFSRKVIAHRVSTQNNNALVVNTFKDAYETRGKPKGLCFHSDRGSNYTSQKFFSLLQSLKVFKSCSKTGSPYDNAVVESFFSNLKREELHSHTFEFYDDLKQCVDEYIEFYNGYRPHQTLGNKTPNEFEAEYNSKKTD